jgi:hypothetical protein
MEMQARLRQLFLRLAEAQLDGQFVRLHRVDCLEQPESHHRQADQPKKGRADIAAAWQRPLEAVLAAPDDVLEVGG